ncbi:hypothetical protein [Bradyrhizobium altum]|uniref:hypothetical protein n=1 Tax=Bradyrhizobium altum TaxID=1571202 RepID=UPI001E60F5C0|nr:hypothetical protein [Bradyrhizobium altum]
MSDALRVLAVEDEALIASFVEDALSDGGFEACGFLTESQKARVLTCFEFRGLTFPLP